MAARTADPLPEALPEPEMASVIPTPQREAGPYVDLRVAYLLRMHMRTRRHVVSRASAPLDLHRWRGRRAPMPIVDDMLFDFARM